MPEFASDWFFVTEPSGVADLQREGKADSAIFYVGHVMVDNVLYQVRKLAGADTSAFETSAFKAANTGGGKRYRVVTLHRPSNVDSAAMMARIGGALTEIAAELPFIFPLHPRTRGNLERFGIDLGPEHHSGGAAAVHGVSEPVERRGGGAGRQRRLAGRDDGAGVPCITIRENTERPVTVEEGTNVLTGADPARIVAEARKLLHGEGKQGRRPHLWDGKAAQRIVAVLAGELAPMQLPRRGGRFRGRSAWRSFDRSIHGFVRGIYPDQ